ncbi:MAG: quinone oxidoreductase [Gammaproteobacteria bacterium]|nr:MAG: quinone oxidoreductase [Gammaproteobacteria bacterium]
MKAIVLPTTGPAEALVYTDLERPEPGPGQILIEVATAGLSFGDVQLRCGLYPHMPPLPFVTGYEAAGVVVGTGAGVPADWLGARVVVVTQGGCAAQYVASYTIFAARLPDSVSFETAIGIGVNYLTARILLRRAAPVARGATMIVYAAAGGVGSALVQLGKLDGAQVIGLAGSEAKCRFVRDLGADAVLQSGAGPLAGAVRGITGAAGAAVVFNSVGGTTLVDDLGMLGPFGQVVLYGMAGGPPAPDFMPAFLGAFGLSPALRLMSLESVAMSDPASMGQILQELVDLAAAGLITPKLHAVLPLAEAAAGHRLLESRQVMGKLVLAVS